VSIMVESGLRMGSKKLNAKKAEPFKIIHRFGLKSGGPKLQGRNPVCERVCPPGPRVALNCPRERYARSRSCGY
jgi:hypothetical protein